MNPAPRLRALRQTIDDLQHPRLALPLFCSTWRAETALLGALPARHQAALDDLLGRLEAAAPFAEHCCCTLDQGGLHASLSRWLDQAQQSLSAGSA